MNQKIKVILSGIIVLLWAFELNAQTELQLTFDDNDKFKILQFTDTHVNMEKNSNLDVYDIIKKVIQIENPHCVILTGDIVTQNNPQKAYRRFADVFKNVKVPWAVVFGNHDSENNLSRSELAAFLENLPYCLNKDKGETYGHSNYVLEVKGQGNRTEALLYCMDSNTYSTLKPMVGGYGWFDISQVNWYLEQSNKFTNGNEGKPLPALAFFHIPLPEYKNAWDNKKNPPLGVKNEDECSPDINTGMFAAMLESGDVMGTFAGHDHINDYIGVHYNIALAYGRVSKMMKDDDDPLAGGRVIVLSRGKREFETWIRDMNGKKELECRWPDSFN